MGDAGRVVPHPVQVGDGATVRRNSVVHAAVGIRVRAVQHFCGRASPGLVPVVPDFLKVAVDAARRDNDDVAGKFTLLPGRSVLRDAAGHPAVGNDQVVDTMLEGEIEPAGVLMVV